MRSFILSLFVLACFGVSPSFADEAHTSDAMQTQGAADVSPQAAGTQLQKMGEAMDQTSSVNEARLAIDKAKCEVKGMKIDEQDGKCVDDENVEMRYVRTWDPLFGDEPVPKPLFNNVR